MPHKQKKVPNNVSLVTLVDLSGSFSQIQMAEAGPSTLSAPVPTSDPHNASFSSIEIETLEDEPAVAKPKRETRRSHSLSRALMSSFRRKKKPQRKEAEEAPSTEANQNPDEESTAYDAAASDDQTGDQQPPPPPAPEAPEEESKFARILRMGSMRRRNKSVSSLPEGSLSSTPTRSNSMVNFFRRERKTSAATASADGSVDLEMNETTDPDSQLGKRRSSIRNSLMRRFRHSKSANDSEEGEPPASGGTENGGRRKPRRSSSMFGSSFSLKKMFHNEPVVEAEDEVAEEVKPVAPVPPPKSSKSKSKSKVKEQEPAPAPAPAPEQLEASPARRNSIGEKLKLGRSLFTRDSFILKKRSGSKPDTPEAAEVEQEGSQGPSSPEPEAEPEAAPEVVENGHGGHQDEDQEPGTLAVTQAEETAESVAKEEEKASHKDQTASNPADNQDEHANDSKQEKADLDEASNAVVWQARDPPPESDPPKGRRPEADKSELAIHRGLVDCPVSTESAQEKVQGLLEDVKLVSLVLNEDILGQLALTKSVEGAQLKEILENPHFKALLKTHDCIADQLENIDSITNGLSQFEMPANISAVRVVGLRKSPGEPLGLTVKNEDGQLVVARILGGGAVDRQGLLHVGDVIGEVNGIKVQTAEQLQVEIARCKEHIQLKILPSCQENGSNGVQSYVRAHFDYDPKDDKLLPCPEIGLAFKKGDILQVVNQSDPNWWQAKKVGWSGPAGLIPSQELEERRKAFVAPEADFVHKIGFCGTRISKKKKKMMYQIKSSVELDKAELLLYEEVTRMPPFRRKSLVLIGSEGIGRRTLKNRLINSDPDRFGTTMPHTSRPMRELEEDGMGYWFVSREEMEHDVRDHQFLECGDHGGHLYGTKLDSIRSIIRQGKMCVLDCSPNALKILHNSPEFMPYVIFLAAPGIDQLKQIYENGRYSSRNLAFDRSSSIRFSSRRARTLESLTSLYEEEDFKNALEESARIQRTYEKYFDQIIVNEDPDVTFRKVVEALEILSNQHQWVPVSWVY